MGLLDAIAREASVAFSDFDEDATWTPAGGTARQVCGIFRRLADPQDIGEMVEVDGVAATFNVATVSVPNIAHGDQMTVRDLSLRVVGIEPDGRGRTRLVLGI